MSQRPKKRLPKDVIAQFRNSGKEEAEIKAMISMFAEILCDNKNGNSSNTRTEEGGTMGQWSVDYYDDGDEKCIQFLRNVGGDDKGSKDDDEEDEEADADYMAEEVEDDQKEGTADKMAEQVTREEALAEEERARNAAKRREKKLRKKEKLKDEAALKAEQATAKKRSARIQSWRSRVIAASQSNEGYKMRNLLSESPLEDNVDAHLESLLPHCNSSQEEASQLLAAFIVNQSCKVVLIPGKNGRNALHTACLNTDSYFVKLVVQQKRGGELDSLCHDSGWTPLHYAVASGSLEIMELLLAAGANAKTCTDDSQTYRSSDGQGITARELAEIIVAGKQDDDIETQGEALQEAKERHAKTVGFLRVLRTMVERLKDVEMNGYTPLSSNVEGRSTDPKSSTVSEEAANKRKKTKKKAAGQLKREQAEAIIPSNAASVEETMDQKEDPLVVALLGMGFTSDQIHESAKACGGMDRATADDMVMWILGGGEESSSPPAAAHTEAVSPKETDSRGNVKIAPARLPTEKSAAVDLKLAQQENLEAVKREQEAHAGAERRAAKKEEQRRRNREWNTRAQARQQEDLERRARQEAQRLAKERAAAQRPVVTGSPAALVGLTVDVSSKPTKAAAPKAPTKILQRPSKPSLKSGPPSIVVPPAKQTRRAQSAGAGRGRGELEPTSQFASSGASLSSGGSERQSARGLQQNPMYGQRPSNMPPPGFHGAGSFPAVSGGSFNLASNEGAARSVEESSTPGEIRATAKAFVPTGFKSTPIPNRISTCTSAPASFSYGLGLPPATQSSALSNYDPLSASGAGLPLGFERPSTATPSGTQSPSTISSSVTGITATDEPSLNSVIGFDLDGSAARPSLLDALSVTRVSSGIESSHGMAGSSIWGSASLAPGPLLSSFSGFGIGEATPAQQAPRTGGSSMGNGDTGACQWNSAGFNQGGTLNGSIW